MTIAFYIPLLCALSLAASAPHLGRSTKPKLAAITLAATALTVGLAADLALGLLVGARLLDAAPVASPLGWRSERPGPIPVPVPISMLAGATLALIAATAIKEGRRTRTTARPLPLEGEAPPAELVVVPSGDMLAYALPGQRHAPGRIVVSDAMLRALDPDERRVLLAHERSHLRHRHDRYLQLARVATMVNPILRPTVGATNLLLERWADEDAAHAVGSKPLTARALARAALATADQRRAAEHASFAAHNVTTRISALLDATPPRAARLAPLLPAALAAAAALGTTLATRELSHLFDLLRGDG
jgi:Zn-dependent protease with chaperone function